MRRRSKRETLLRAFAHLQEYSRARQRESEGVRGGAVEARDFYTKSVRLPRKLMEMEVLFNVGRAFHQVRERRSEEHTSELQSRTGISYAVFCLKKIFF